MACATRGTARPVPPVLLAQPDPGTVADLDPRPGPAGRRNGAVRDRPAVLRRLQPRPQPGQRHDSRQGMARLLPVLLADPAGMALPGQPGRARHPGAGPRPDPAGQAVVGAAEAVRVAAAPQPGARTGTAVAVPARRRGRVRVRHRDHEHPAVVRVPRLLLHPALLRRLGLRGRLRGARGPEVPRGDQGAARPRAAAGTARQHRPHAPGTAGCRVPRQPGARGAHDLPARRAGLRGRRVTGPAGAVGGPVDRRPAAPHRPARAARAGHRQRARRLPGQRDRGRGRHQGRADRGELAAHPYPHRAPPPAARPSA